MLELLLGQIPEAIYFALFMIFVKDLKERRLLFTILMVIEYTLLLHAMPYSIYAHVGFFITTYILLKILYKEKAQIIDVFTLGIASIILIISSILSFIISSQNVILATIINRAMLFTFLFIFNYRLNNIQKLYKRIWNRDKNKTKIKSTTFRSINLVLFNIAFYVLNLCIVYAIYYNSK